MVDHFEILIEEPSAEAALRLLLPKVLPVGATFELYVSNGKTDLLKNLPNRLQGYRAWLPPSWRVVVLVDRDDDDCMKLKKELETICANAGLSTKSIPSQAGYSVVNRIAVEELEAWFFGDWVAVRAAYPRVSAHQVSKAGFRDPDAITGGTWEAFERIMKRHGYFTTGLRKIEAAEEVALHMVPARNTSRSFAAFLNALV